MKRRPICILIPAIAAIASAGGHAQTAPQSNALTIYSAARPGAIPPELYRQGGGTGAGIPGYALVRHERDLGLEHGRNTVRYTDVAALRTATWGCRCRPGAFASRSSTRPRATGRSSSSARTRSSTRPATRTCSSSWARRSTSSASAGRFSFSVDTSRRTMTEEIEVKVRNQKKEPVAVIVKENLYRWVNWTIAQKTHDCRKEDARTIHFPVRIAAGAEATVRYAVTYIW